MHEGDVDFADREHVACAMSNEVPAVDFRRAHHPIDLIFVDVNRNVVGFKEVRDAIDPVTHHRTPDVVRVVVGREDARQCHPIGSDDRQQFVHGVGRIDDHAVPCLLVAEQVDVVDHLRGETIAHREVAAGEQLAEVEPIVCGHVLRLWPTVMSDMNARFDTKILVGDHLVDLTAEMTEALESGGRVIPLRSTGDVLVVPPGVRSLVDSAVDGGVRAFGLLQHVDPMRVDDFFRRFAALIDDDTSFAPVLEANARDVESAVARGRATGRLQITPKMRHDMSAGLRMWADLDLRRTSRLSVVEHEGWSVESWRAPLGVVAFVFEGRPNVFADATGVVKSGNAVVFRIGSDALGTARAIRDHLLVPALAQAGLPDGLVALVDSPEHSAGWGLFDDSRIALAVARGSGPAVNQLGEIARQVGTPVSLHGTGGAWVIVGSTFDGERLGKVVEHSLDRKVCNTLNTIVLLEPSLSDALPLVASGLARVGDAHRGRVIVHAEDPRVVRELKESAALDVVIEAQDPGREWEWDQDPELTVVVVPSIADAVSLFNSTSPRFVLSVVSNLADEEDLAWHGSEAPFFGDGFTRWVDGQFALSRPELGLANWQSGRLLGRGGVLSGDSVHTVRLRVRQSDADLRR